MPKGPWCGRCMTHVIIESDGRSCSNCGATLTLAAPPPTKPAPKKPAPKK